MRVHRVGEIKVDLDFPVVNDGRFLRNYSRKCVGIRRFLVGRIQGKMTEAEVMQRIRIGLLKFLDRELGGRQAAGLCICPSVQGDSLDNVSSVSFSIW